MRTSFSTFACFLTLAGCEAAAVNVKHVTPSGATINDLLLDVELEVTNSHSFDVKVEQITANATVAGKFQLEPIRQTVNTWIAAHTHGTFHLAVQVPWRELPGIETIVVLRNGLEYTVSGVAYVVASRALEWSDKEPFKASGFVSRTDLLNKMLKSPAPLPIPSQWPLPFGIPQGFPQ